MSVYHPSPEALDARKSELRSMADDGVPHHVAAERLGMTSESLRSWMNRNTPDLKAAFAKNSADSGYSLTGTKRGVSDVRNVRAVRRRDTPSLRIPETIRLTSLDDLEFSGTNGAIVVPRELMEESGVTVEDIVARIDASGKPGQRTFYSYHHTKENAQVISWRPSPTGSRV